MEQSEEWLTGYRYLEMRVAEKGEGAVKAEEGLAGVVA